MSDFQQQALRLAQQQQGLSWLQDFRAQAANDWTAQAWPTRKTEHWKYTSLAALQKFTPQDWGQSAAESIEFIELDATRLVFVNGVFDAARSSELPAEVVRFSQANGAQQAVIEQHLGAVVDGKQHLFATLNNAWLNDGVLVQVPRGVNLAKPIYVVYMSTAAQQEVSVNQRLLVVLEDSSQAEVIEHFVSGSEQQNSFVNALTEIVVGDNAQLQHYRLNLEEENIQHIGAVHVNLLRNARLRGFTLALGSRLKRID
jgi:Fe-S cluster assembly protein SufD